MQKIYIDVTKLMEVNFITGIQRVVRNVILEMNQTIPERLELLVYSKECESFCILNRKNFIRFVTGELDSKEELFTSENITPADMGVGNIFFDILILTVLGLRNIRGAFCCQN